VLERLNRRCKIIIKNGGIKFKSEKDVKNTIIIQNEILNLFTIIYKLFDKQCTKNNKIPTRKKYNIFYLQCGVILYIAKNL
jgi:hypothetical protein